MKRTEWEQLGVQLFGEDRMQWKFRCPSCGYVASVQKWKDLGAPEGAVAFSCVGRWMESPKQAFGQDGGPCNYAGGGLFAINPVFIDDTSTRVFEFADR